MTQDSDKPPGDSRRAQGGRMNRPQPICPFCGKRVATLLVEGKTMCKPCYDNQECDDLEDELHDIDGTL